MNQNIWGPHLWFSLHTISFNYPLRPKKEEINQYHNFFTSLQNVIPCSVCKKNYIRHLKEHPINQFLNNRKDLVYWVIDMHNMVNAEIGKKILENDIIQEQLRKMTNERDDIKLISEEKLKNTLTAEATLTANLYDLKHQVDLANMKKAQALSEVSTSKKTILDLLTTVMLPNY